MHNLKSQLYREYYFWSEQKLGWKKPKDAYSIPKYILKKYLPDNPVIIDCGANEGTDSVELARIFPRGVVHSFEPVPEMFQRLKDRTKEYKNIQCYELALNSNTSKVKMFLSSGASDAASSLLQPKSILEDHKALYFDNTIEVQCMSLDDWAAANGVSRVDFLWLDMQGSEFKTLNASKKILDTAKVILTEVSLKETYEGVPLYTDFRKWLESKGFEVMNEAIPPGTDMGNALFVKR